MTLASSHLRLFLAQDLQETKARPFGDPHD
jgi:hypothetical protein